MVYGPENPSDGLPGSFAEPQPIENLWGDLSMHVYKIFKQYDTVQKLPEVIADALEEIDEERCENLEVSLKNRCIHVINHGGKKTGY